MLAREPERLEQAATEVRDAGGEALVVPVDVADAEAVEKAAERAEQSFGSIDIWVNCAMVAVFSPVHEMTAEEIRRVTEVTYLGTVHGTLSALRRMRRRGAGTIVQVGSALSYRAIPLQSGYCAAKFAIRGFTDALRTELLHENSDIHVTMVQLSAFNTPQFDWARYRTRQQPQPVPPIFQPELAARGIVWAARHRRRELCVGFPAVKAIVLNKFFPGVADRYLSKTAFSGQRDADRPAQPENERQDNLFRPVKGSFGSHGRFDAKARRHSWQLVANFYRAPLLAVTTLLLLALITMIVQAMTG